VALKIWEAEHWQDENGKWHSEYITDAVADDAIFGGRQDNSKDIAEQFADAFIELDKEHHTNTKVWRRVGKGPKSRISGRLEVHHRLKVPTDTDGKPTGEAPMVQVFTNCKHLIRTLPELLNDEKNWEDVDTTMEDHAYDQFRYAMMSRPMTTKRKVEEKGLVERHKERLAKTRVMNRARIM
jgi:hypothetical protein